jgi:hypothetical protein
MLLLKCKYNAKNVAEKGINVRVLQSSVNKIGTSFVYAIRHDNTHASMFQLKPISRQIRMLTWEDFLNRSSNRFVSGLLLESTLEWREYFHQSRMQAQFLQKMAMRKLQHSTFLPYVENEDRMSRMENTINHLLNRLRQQEESLALMGLKVKAEIVEPVFKQFLYLQEEMLKAHAQLEEDKRNHLQMLSSLAC